MKKTPRWKAMEFNMEHLKFLIKLNNILGYILIATVILSPVGFIQVLLGYLVLMKLDQASGRESFPGEGLRYQGKG